MMKSLPQLFVAMKTCKQIEQSMSALGLRRGVAAGQPPKAAAVQP
jgi:hypothetical protein